MSEILQLSLLAAQESVLRQSLEGSPARTSAARGIGKELKAIAAPYSLKLSDSFAHLPQGSLSWKTWQRCLDGDWTEFSGSLPKSGTMRNGALWQRPKWELATGATGSGSSHGPLLPTPKANDNENRRTKPTPAELEGRHGWALRSAIAGIELGVYPKLLPTPTVCGNNNRKGGSAKAGDGLTTAVKKMLPTPKATDGEHPGVATCKPGQTLHLSAAVMLPTPVTSDWRTGSAAQVEKPRSELLRDRISYLATPQSRDWKGNSGAGFVERGGNQNLPTQLNAGKKLNPIFVSCMMGFPVSWTDLQAEIVSAPALLSPYDVADLLPYATDTAKIPYRKEQLMALGNAVVPQCAAIALQRAKEIISRLDYG
jgi:hypothetical protein